MTDLTDRFARLRDALVEVIDAIARARIDSILDSESVDSSFKKKDSFTSEASTLSSGESNEASVERECASRKRFSQFDFVSHDGRVTFPAHEIETLAKEFKGIKDVRAQIRLACRICGGGHPTKERVLLFLGQRNEEGLRALEKARIAELKKEAKEAKKKNGKDEHNVLP